MVESIVRIHASIQDLEDQSDYSTTVSSIASITKGKYTAIVVMHIGVIMVTRIDLMEDGEAHCAFIRNFEENKDAAIECYQETIAQLCHVEEDSIFFANSEYDEEFKNVKSVGVAYGFAQSTMKIAIEKVKSDFADCGVNVG